MTTPKVTHRHETTTVWDFNEDAVEKALRQVFNIPKEAVFSVIFEDEPQFIRKEVTYGED